MQIKITDDAIYIIIMGLLFIAFLPHIHLFIIFTVMTIADSLEYMSKLLSKFIKFTFEYIFPLAIIFYYIIFYDILFYLAILKKFMTVLNSILGAV